MLLAPVQYRHCSMMRVFTLNGEIAIVLRSTALLTMETHLFADLSRNVSELWYAGQLYLGMGAGMQTGERLKMLGLTVTAC